jgi:hypothetical protein
LAESAAVARIPASHSRRVRRASAAGLNLAVEQLRYDIGAVSVDAGDRNPPAAEY